MSQRFLKFIPCEEVELLLKKPFCHALLTLVAIRARRNPDHPDGLQPGECYIGDHESIGATRQEYRTALKYCVSRKYLTILETCRTRKKSTTGLTTIGTKVKLLDSGIWDINLLDDNHRPNHCLTTDQPPTNHEQERKRKKKKEEAASNPIEKAKDENCFKSLCKFYPWLSEAEIRSLMKKWGGKLLEDTLRTLSYQRPEIQKGVAPEFWISPRAVVDSECRKIFELNQEEYGNKKFG